MSTRGNRLGPWTHSTCILLALHRISYPKTNQRYDDTRQELRANIELVPYVTFRGRLFVLLVYPGHNSELRRAIYGCRSHYSLQTYEHVNTQIFSAVETLYT